MSSFTGLVAGVVYARQTQQAIVKVWKPLALGITVAAAVTTAFVPMLRSTARSVRPVSLTEASAPSTFDREHSAALFVGVRSFRNDGMLEVPFAVDDAIDLAYVFALDRHVRLVEPERVVLALAGQPVKPESHRRLRELRAAGAVVRTADHGAILSLLRQQAALAGRSGLLIVSLATHGFVRGGVPFVVGASSEALSTATMLDVIAEHDVPRSLIFVDACRERSRGARGVNANAFAVTALNHKMPHIRGQVMLSAVDYAYDDPLRRNGVFTAAVIDGLNCNATAPRGQVTADTLAAYVERVVHGWIAKNRNPRVGSAIQISIDGEAKNMPLSQCWTPPLNVSVSAKESLLSVFSSDGKTLLWQRDVGSRIAHHETADAAVIVGTRSAITAFDGDGNRIWSANDGSPLRTFITADLFRKHRSQIVALWGSHVAIYSADGALLSTYEHPQPLHGVAICRPTSHHAPRIVVHSAHGIFLLDPKKIARGKPIWSGHLLPQSETIDDVKIRDYDHDTKSDIALSTASGATLVLDFKGKVIGRTSKELGFELDRRRRLHKT